jgi:hypothetical protein
LFFPTARRSWGATWPSAQRWDGRAVRSVLLPAVYDEFIRQAREYLAREWPERIVEVRLRTQLGHALQLQGRVTEARAEYEPVWEMAQPRPEPCRDPIQAVRAYYGALDPFQGNLPQAYLWLGEEVRRGQPFPTFAAGLAGNGYHLIGREGNRE